MRTIPIDSTDAREQRERDVEDTSPVVQPSPDVPASRDNAPARPHSPDCTDGWLGEDAAGRVRPCPECRPHLVALPDGRVVHHATLVRRQLEEI